MFRVLGSQQLDFGIQYSSSNLTPPLMPEPRTPARILNSQAPIRICDNGGWTDTWFARHGRVLNIAVSPVVEVQLRIYNDRRETAPITIHAENYGDHYSMSLPKGNYGRHPLIEAAFDCLPFPENQSIEMSIYSTAPAGCSTGTSAALTVAILGALDCLTPGRMTPDELAATAQRIETDFLHRQCGIQDQIAAAFGGVNFIEMHEYPYANVKRIDLPNVAERELEARLALIYVGASHSSSDVHEAVIRSLESAGPEAPQLKRLRDIATRSRDALWASDFAAFGRCMIENTDAQRDLHPGLVGTAHQQVIEVAREHGAVGWKVNGAGGEGGSVTLLCGPNASARRSMLREIEATNPQFRNIPTRLNTSGLTVWDSPL